MAKNVFRFKLLHLLFACITRKRKNKQMLMIKPDVSIRYEKIHQLIHDPDSSQIQNISKQTIE